MEKNKFLQELQERAQEQTIVSQVPFPKVFLFLGQVVGQHPWRILIPLSFLVTLLFHLIGGMRFDNWLLWMMGGV